MRLLLVEVCSPWIVRQFAAGHDANTWGCLASVIGVQAPSAHWQVVASLQFSFESLVLTSATRKCKAAHWTSWTDSLAMIQKRPWSFTHHRGQPSPWQCSMFCGREQNWPGVEGSLGLAIMGGVRRRGIACSGRESGCELCLMRTLAPLPSTTLSQVMSPTSTTSRRPLNRTSRNPPTRTGPKMTSCAMTSPSAWRSLHHCSPTSEKMMRAVDELMTKVCRPVSRRRLSVTERDDPLWNSLTHKFQTSEKIRATPLSKSGFFWNDKKEQILADCQAEIQKHEFQADQDRRSIQKLNEMIESRREEIFRAHQGDERLRRDQPLLHKQLLAPNRDLREAHEKSLNDVEEFTFDTISRRKLVEDRDTILELTGKIPELQNEIKCMTDSRDFQDAESVRSGRSHVTSQPVFFPPHPDPEGMLSRSFGVPSRREGRQAFGTHMVHRETFLQIQQRLLQHLSRKNRIHDRSLTWSTSTSGSLEPMIPSRIMPTYLLLLFEMMVFRNSIRNGTEFYYQWLKSHLMTSWKDCTK